MNSRSSYSYKSVASNPALGGVGPAGTSSGGGAGGGDELNEPHLRFYKSLAGYNAIMSWYESVLEEVTVPLKSMYVETRFGRTHMLVCGPEDAPPLFLIPGTAGCA